MLSPAQVRREQQKDEEMRMLEESRQRAQEEAAEQLQKLEEQMGTLNSKLVSIKFKIERQSIKNGAREERRNSIHRLEIEKNLVFRPKRDRAKSIPTIHNNHRLKALREIKGQLTTNENKIPEEFTANDFEVSVPVHEYCFNDIKRDIMDAPVEEPWYPDKRKKKSLPQSPVFDNIHNYSPLPPRGMGQGHLGGSSRHLRSDSFSRDLEIHQI